MAVGCSIRAACVTAVPSLGSRDRLPLWERETDRELSRGVGVEGTGYVLLSRWLRRVRLKGERKGGQQRRHLGYWEALGERLLGIFAEFCVMRPLQDKGSEDQRGYVAYPQSHSKEPVQPEMEPGLMPKPLLIPLQ